MEMDRLIQENLLVRIWSVIYSKIFVFTGLMVTEDKAVDAEEEKKKAETVDKNVSVCSKNNQN